MKTRISHLRFRQLLAALSLQAALAACDAPMSELPGGDLETQESNLYQGAGVTLWSANGNTVPVCWEMRPQPNHGDVNGAQYTTWRQKIKDAIVSGWQGTTSVRFTGWGACPESGTQKFVRILMYRATGATTGIGGGAALMGMAALMSPPAANTCGPEQGGCPQRSVWIALADDTSTSRIQYLARHEFGHILGFDHEQNSPGNTGSCPPDTGANTSGIVLSSYDVSSLMSYCGNILSGAMTTKDIRGARKAYRFPMGDFNLNGIADILWHNGTTGANEQWLLGPGGTFAASQSINHALDTKDSTGWRGVGQADFNLDGKSDILWHNGTTGATQIWFMNGTERLSFADLPSSLNIADSTGWRIAATGDFDQDAKPDILWRHGPTGAMQVWYMDGATRISFGDFDSPLLRADSTGWTIVGLGDFDQDGLADLLWHNGTTGVTDVWYMNNTVRQGQATFSSSLNTPDSSGWRMVGVDDYNGDGRPDILAHNLNSGAVQFWVMNNATRTSFVDFPTWANTPASTGWSVVKR
jgi:hypothetical protein